MYLCRLCGRQFQSLNNTLPEEAFEPSPEHIDAELAAAQDRRKGMTKLVPRFVPDGYTPAPGYAAVMIDGIIHEFSTGGAQ